MVLKRRWIGGVGVMLKEELYKKVVEVTRVSDTVVEVVLVI